MEDTPYHLETHMAHTEDGFVLVLHRLVPKKASGAGSDVNGSGSTSVSSSNGSANGNGGKRGGSLRFGRSDSSTVRGFSQFRI